MDRKVGRKKERGKEKTKQQRITGYRVVYEGWNFNSGNYLFTTDTK